MLLSTHDTCRFANPSLQTTPPPPPPLLLPPCFRLLVAMSHSDADIVSWLHPVDAVSKLMCAGGYAAGVLLLHIKVLNSIDLALKLGHHAPR